MSAVKAIQAVEVAAPETEEPQETECMEIATHPDHTRLVRLFYVSPFPDRLLLLKGVGADAGLLLVAAAPDEPYAGVADGHYRWAHPQVSGGFCFEKAVLVTLCDDDDAIGSH